MTQALSITTFRYVPPMLRLHVSEPRVAEYLDTLNRELLGAIQRGGEVFVSNAVVQGRFVLRACIVNFHTTLADVEAVPEIVVGVGAELDARMRAQVRLTSRGQPLAKSFTGGREIGRQSGCSPATVVYITDDCWVLVAIFGPRTRWCKREDDVVSSSRRVVVPREAEP